MTIRPLRGCLLEIIVTVEDIRVVDGHDFVAASFDGRFLALPTMASRYGAGGTDAPRRSLELTGYTSGTSRKVRVAPL